MSVVFLSMQAESELKIHIVQCLIVILCTYLCGAVHLLQQREVDINSMRYLK